MTPVPTYFNPISVTYQEGEVERTVVITHGNFNPVSGQLRGHAPQVIADWRRRGHQQQLIVFEPEQLTAIAPFTGSSEELEALNAPFFGAAQPTPVTNDPAEAMEVGSQYRITLQNGVTAEIQVVGYVGNYVEVLRLDMNNERMVMNPRGAHWVRH